MSKKQKTTATVIEQTEIAPDIFDLRLETALAKDARPGQFVGVYPREKDLLLPRPISVCDVPDDGALRLVYRIAGKGTDAFSRMRRGDGLGLLGVLGNGFPPDAAAGKRAVLIGGGIGVPPLLYLAKTLHAQAADAPRSIVAILGYRDEKTFLADEFDNLSTLRIATENGAKGARGNAVDAYDDPDAENDVVFACGPMPMLRALKQKAGRIPTYLSLEERMACGVGACLACVCPLNEADAHTRVKNARVCTEGPVFDANILSI